MAKFTHRGDRLGEGLRFDDDGRRMRVEIGDVWFSSTDTAAVRTDSPASRGAAFLGGEDEILSLGVETASGQLATFDPSSDGLDLAYGLSGCGAELFFVSEPPGDGRGGRDAGPEIETTAAADRAPSSGETFEFDDGADRLFGAASRPRPRDLDGTDGGDRLFGRGGRDTIDGGSGGDLIDGRGGGDVLNSGSGNDRIFGRRGADTIDAGRGSDRIDGGAGPDSLFGGGGKDTILGRGGRDLIDGGGGNDRIKGHGGRDLILGGDGDDRLFGGRGADDLAGEAGNDVLDGGADGGDDLTGGLGSDVFVFGPNNLVRDFRAAAGDIVAIHAARGATFSDLSIARSGGDTLISLGGATMRLEDVSRRLDADDFDFGYTDGFSFL